MVVRTYKCFFTDCHMWHLRTRIRTRSPSIDVFFD